MKTFHRKMWEAKEKGHISEEVWKKLCNQRLEAFNCYGRWGLGVDYTEHSYHNTLGFAMCWDETNEGEDYWYDLYYNLRRGV